MNPLGVIHLVSVSGGKDSTATLLLALEQFPVQVEAVFADTGNEHEATYEYLEYLEQRLGLKITRLRADFTEELAHRRQYVQERWPGKGVSQTVVDRAVKLLQPTGNPFLDLCLVKARFPSRLTQFCTQELKTKPLTEHALWYIDATGCSVWSWQGVRRDESDNRKNALGFEDLSGGLYAWRPVAGWTAQQVVDFVRSRGVKLNLLYEQGMTRVGCMPCINANKLELAEISRRFPEHIERIAEWERLVADVSRRGGASFFISGSEDRRNLGGETNVYAHVRWARTFRGGKVEDPSWNEPAPQCSSSYGLCE